MATGYTDGVRTGKVTDFREFALLCSRAMGALIEMKDDSFDADIPDVFQADIKYSEEEEAEAKDRLAWLMGLTRLEQEGEVAKENAEQLAEWRESISMQGTVCNRYVAMLDEVKSWNPPTCDHVGLKQFMESQLKESINHDCYAADPEPVALTASEWFAREVATAARNLERAGKYKAEEIKKVNGRNAWIKALRESL